MQVILLERLGNGRNFLLPKQKAMRATKDNLAVVEARRAELEARNVEQKSDAEKVASRMKSVKLTLVRQAGEGGQLYGSVTARDVGHALKEAGYTVGREQISSAEPVKTIGTALFQVRLHAEVMVTIPVTVARSEDEAKAIQAQEAKEQQSYNSESDTIAA
jgi:large subunit ribosomal protein L9